MRTTDPKGHATNTQDLKDQLALDLGDTAAKLTVRDLVVRGEIETPKPRARRPKPVPTFERALVDGADCALRRRCGAKSELLVLLATQGQAYVMDERTGRRHALTAGRLAAFCDGATGNALTPPWSADALQDYDPAARKTVVRLFASEDFCQMARRDMLRVSAWELSRRAFNKARWRIRCSDKLEACTACPYVFMCRGGCGSDAKRRTGSPFHEECGEFKEMFSYAASRELARRWKTWAKTSSLSPSTGRSRA